MVNSKTEVDQIMDDIARQRDELTMWVRHAKAEAKEEWWKLELKLERVKTNLNATRSARQESISASLELAIEEIKDGYARLRRMM
jgi:hypothetical protein